jgi:hypothetical protein
MELVKPKSLLAIGDSVMRDVSHARFVRPEQE